MSTEIPIEAARGIELRIKSPGIAAVIVNAPDAIDSLSWDRFVRLKAASDAVLKTNVREILDAGGYDGALGFFLPRFSIDLIDPVTTGGSILEIPVPEKAYDAVVAIDVLEHIEPADRRKALSELARVAKRFVILNYPCQDSKEAQELAFKLTNNSMIKEHVEWDLPDSKDVLRELGKYGFKGTVQPHTSIAVWLGQHVTLNLAPKAAKDLNQHLILNFQDEPFSKALYHLVVCERDS